MTDSELQRRLRLGEDTSLECNAIRVEDGKVREPAARDFADELAAMANGRGGTVVLGVDDARSVQGIRLDDLDAVETWVRDICNDLVKPALDADILKRELPNSTGQLRAVVRIDVARSLFVHESPHGYFRRLGSSKRRMSPEVLARAFQERSQSRMIRFDESIVPNTARGDLHYGLTSRFLRDEWEGGVEGDDDALRKLRVLSADADGNPRLTLAGVLMCCPNPQQWLPHAYIQAVGYAGERTDQDYQLDARDIGGPLDDQVSQALRFLERNMLVRAAKQQARSERPAFSERAVFEALVNAVAHRDYSVAGARIRMHLFTDRLELYVPGALANTLKPDSLHLRQSNRNELLVSLLGRCPAPTGLGRTRMMDTRGDGVPIIREECERLSGRLPEYDPVDDSELRLVIWAA